MKFSVLPSMINSGMGCSEMMTSSSSPTEGSGVSANASRQSPVGVSAGSAVFVSAGFVFSMSVLPRCRGVVSDVFSG